MKKIVAFTFLLITISINSIAQTFIDKAEIEYEVKTNVKKTMGNNSFAEMWAIIVSQKC